MDFLNNPADILSVASAVLLLLMNNNAALELATLEENMEDDNMELDQICHEANTSALDTDLLMSTAINSFRLFTSVHLLGEDLGYWVKPRSTTWFSRFLLEQFDEDRWVRMFRMTKSSVFALAELLKREVEKKNTRYRLAIPVVVRVACTLFKLTHGASLLICSEMFAVRRSSVSMLLRQVVHAINDVLRGEISWPRGQKMLEVEADFRHLCGLPGVLGAVDGTHVAISKPHYCPVDYYYFKSGGYSLNCQAVVDSRKRFLDLYLGMPGSTNDSRVLRRSTMYALGRRNCLWDSGITFEGFSPYILGDAGYLLLPWLMVPNLEQRDLSVADALFNRRQKRGRCVVENAFAILKQTFRELLGKSDLHVTFLPDVIACCAILHNTLLRQTGEDLERLLNVLRTEGYSDPSDEAAATAGAMPNDGGDQPIVQRVQKRRSLGLHLAAERAVPH